MQYYLLVSTEMKNHLICEMGNEIELNNVISRVHKILAVARMTW